MSAQQRRGWRYLATRLNGDGTETLLHPDLPIEDVTIEEVLSGDGSISGKIEPVYRTLLGDDGAPILTPWSAAIYAENNGTIRAGGILSRSGWREASWELEATGFTSYGRDMPYTADGYKGIRVDPMNAARVIWQHIQSQPGGNIGLTFAPTTTGGKKTIGTEERQVDFDTQEGPVSFESGPYKLNWYSNHDLQGDFDTLAAETPFDYVERHSWAADDSILHRVDMGYPKIGRRREDLTFTYGVNIFEAPGVEQDGSTYASGTLVLGAGDTNTMIHSVRERIRPPGAPLRRIAVVVDDSIKSKTAADRRADAENQWRARVDDIESFVVQDHPHAPLGAASLGDEIYVEGRTGWKDVGMWVRILGIAYQPANGDIAEYSVARTDRLMS